MLAKPKQIITSQPVLESVADKPRRHIGDVVYDVTLEPARFHDPVTGRPPKSAFKSTPKPLPWTLIKNKENCTLTMKVSKAHLLPDAREEITSRRAVWGTDVYTDDSDVVGACIHGGWFRGEWPDEVDVDMLGLYPDEPPPVGRGRKAIQHITSENLPTPDFLDAPLATGPVNVPPNKDLHVTLLILPKLQTYASTVRYGIKSRQWGSMPSYTENREPQYGRCAPHDGLSFKVVSIRWVTNGAGAQSRLRGAARRERMSRAMREVEMSTMLESMGAEAGGANGNQRLPSVHEASVGNEKVADETESCDVLMSDVRHEAVAQSVMVEPV